MASIPSSLEHALLGLLQKKPQSGYDLRKLFATTPVRHFSDSPGSIYPALRRLEQRQWIAGEKEDGRNRQVFRVTAAGRRQLVAWLRQPIGRDDIVWRLGELVLRFAFLEGNVPRAHVRGFLAVFARVTEAYLRELERYAAESHTLEATNTGALAFANGLEGYRAQLRWARVALKKLSEVQS